VGVNPQVIKSPWDILSIDEVQMRKMDKQSISSLAGKNEQFVGSYASRCNELIIGIKDTEVLIKYIPSLEKFRLVAHLIRLWAKSKYAVYR
jgi:poly(A) polymerase Pap1